MRFIDYFFLTLSTTTIIIIMLLLVTPFNTAVSQQHQSFNAMHAMPQQQQCVCCGTVAPCVYSSLFSILNAQIIVF
uniref:Uncharacterized protein n=1 Tax=Anopheles darlingi TaxID=43151 RepID=A0A2M4DS70_ANODA